VRTIMALCLLCAGCQTMERILQPRTLTFEERQQLIQNGFQLMELGRPYVLPAPLPANVVVPVNCTVYPPNKITGQQQVVCH